MTADLSPMGTAALDLARAGWEVLPLAGKVPAIKGGRGVLDASRDPERVTAWWSGRFRHSNVGARVPERLVVLDVDPRNGGADSMTALTRAHGLLPSTLSVASGRGDGGRHFYLRRPAGELSAARLGPGLDLKTHAGYVVVPPSVHPDTGQPYRRMPGPRTPAVMPAWLVSLLAPPAPPPRPEPRRLALRGGPGVADAYSASARWSDVLGPHGWRCVGGDGDSDGARWLHPAATSSVSATVRHGLLFVFTTSTALPVTEPGSPHGLTKFRAYALLDHGGDMSAAARALRSQQAVTAA